MATPSFDLTKLLPTQYRDKTIDTLLKSVFNRQLSKEDTVPLFGYIGDSKNLQANEVSIKEADLERQINQLTPLIIAKHASEKKIYSWPDLLKKLSLLGVDYKSVSSWLKSKSYNFAPPIDLDKFANFNEYFWIGEWLKNHPTLPYHELGINLEQTTYSFNFSDNLEFLPEYYVIQKGELSFTHQPLNIQPGINGWSDWSYVNLWIHKDDIIDFISRYGAVVGYSEISQAKRPIIEFNKNVKLNLYKNSLGEPSDFGNKLNQSKFRRNQPPLFDLYTHDKFHAGVTSSIFFYKESSLSSIDSELQRRITVDENNDFTFGISLVNADNSLLFFKELDDEDYKLSTIWKSGPDVAPRYIKYDVSGTIINQDKFKNYKNYYWMGIDYPVSDLPSYNVTGLPEYYVIEKTKQSNSDFSKYNYWLHVSQIQRSVLDKYIQATKPIIEFNASLESELLKQKTSFNELPKFNLYTVNNAGDYNLISADAYNQNHLLARITDLKIESIVTNSPDIKANTFKYEDDLYLQSFVNGSYVSSKDGINYGYKSSVAFQESIGNGSINIISTSFLATPELIEFVFGGSKFALQSSVSNTTGFAQINQLTTVGNLTLSIIQGTIPFEIGDRFIVEIKTYFYDKTNYYVNLNGSYKSFVIPADIINLPANSDIIQANSNNLDGVWEVPPQLEFNIQNETRSEIKQGDLYFHFISIIKAQNGLIGSERGKNNFRLLNQNLGLGGTIKQFDGSMNLFVSLLMQEDISIHTLIDFARLSYENLTLSIKSFIQDRIPYLINDRRITLPTDNNIDPFIVSEFKKYFANASKVVDASASTIDDHLASSFYDSTSSISNLVATLPYLGLSKKVMPQKVLDKEQNKLVIIHHDGHKTNIDSTSVETLKKIVKIVFKRSPGQESEGIISGFNFPKHPYKSQFWYKTTTEELFVYNVVSDTGERPAIANNGDFSYDRQNSKMYQYNGEWVNIGTDEVTISLAWEKVNVSLLEQNLTLAIEAELYQNCPDLELPLDFNALETRSDYEELIKKEFDKFGALYGIPDIYGSTFDNENPFTWNYSNATITNVVGNPATWHQIYLQVYGTSRPDIEPWIPAGYASEAEMLTELISLDLIPSDTTEWHLTFWPSTAAFLKGKYNLNGIPVLSIDYTTGALIPPFKEGYSEILLENPPINAGQRFKFGDLGPIELLWKSTTNYLYSKQKVFFKQEPLKYVESTWGIKRDIIGDYVLNSNLGKKESVGEFQLHGEVLTDLITNSWISVSCTEIPERNLSYKISCISRKENIFKLSSDILVEPIIFKGFYFEGFGILVNLQPGTRGFFWGDTFIINVSDLGLVEVVTKPQNYLKAEGFNQLYVQYNRSYGKDLQISANYDLLNNWTTKLGYRFSGLVNTDLLNFTYQDTPIDNSAYKVYLKENKFLGSYWLNALKIQLVKAGSSNRVNGVNVPKIGPNGSPGEDWVFRVDNFNSNNSGITWYKYANQETQSFIALDGKITNYAWNKPLDKTVLQRYNTPFLITGLQNIVNFITGFAEKLHDDGWRFSDTNSPRLDAATGRPFDYQLLIEKFLVQQFSGVDNGSDFVFNPFAFKVWFETKRGVVSNVTENLGIEQEISCTIIDENKNKLSNSNLRIFRQDNITEINFEIPVYTVHIFTSEYEHVVLFENYSIDTLLISDSFLGQSADNIFINGQKQSNFSGRLDFGGHFLLNNQMKRNIETSVSGILKLYDSSKAIPNLPETERARALLGFQKKDYFSLRSAPDQTEFRFWQALISKKGTNLSINAFVNTPKFKTATLDEYWAYKVATYGEYAQVEKPEMKVEPEDCRSEKTNYLFLESNESEDYKILRSTGGLYDIPDYDAAVYDSGIYSQKNAKNIEIFDAAGCLVILPEDESRWFKYEDLNTLQYFEAAIIAENVIVPQTLNKLITVLDSYGKPVRADAFEIQVDAGVSVANAYDEFGYSKEKYDMFKYEGVFNSSLYETGDFIPGTQPVEFSEPKFKRINHSTIQLLDSRLIGRALKVIAYAPAFSKYSPVELYNYVDNVIAKGDMIFWDPARDVHHPAAISIVDYKSVTDPANYNRSVFNYKNTNLATTKPWGENQISKVWWNKRDLAWVPYSDTKIYHDFQDRLATWGKLADYSSIELYEWIKSDVPPAEYKGDGEPAITQFNYRTRTWQQRPIAWRYSDNPELTPRTFLTYQPSELKIANGIAILKSGLFEDFGIVKDSKFAIATYSSNPGIDSNLNGISGTAKVTSDSSFVVVGSAAGYDDGPKFATSEITFGVEVDNNIITFNSNILGQYILDNEFDNVSTYYARITHVATGNSQQLEIRDTPIKANTQDVYFFDQLGIKIIISASFSHGNQEIELTRKQKVAFAFGNSNHEIYLRSAVNVFVAIPFGQNILTKWIAWNDPVINPNTKAAPPYNLYEPMSGSWENVTSVINLADDIEQKLADPWIGFDRVSYVPYRSNWSDWNIIDTTIRVAKYDTLATNYTAFFNQYFSYTTNTLELKTRASVYLNNKLLNANKWKVIENGFSRVVIIDFDILNLGDEITVRINAPQITDAALKFDPDLKDDPLKNVQFKKDTPHVYEERRDVNGNLTIKNYYFWVKNKNANGKPNSLSIKQASELLRQHDDSYTTPQIMKFADQVEGKPHRYAMLSVNNLSQYVRRKNSYKLRMNNKPILRDSDDNLSLKNQHVEWKLLRKLQSAKIPHELWNLVIDSLVGKNQLDTTLPYADLDSYDNRNNTSNRYGFKSNQVLLDSEIAKATLKHTLLNTNINKYMNNELVRDYVSYESFDINQIDNYLSSADSIRKFMNDLWRLAKPKQINEIFFAILEDAIEKNLELTDFFKTSFISMNDIRTIEET